MIKRRVQSLRQSLSLRKKRNGELLSAASMESLERAFEPLHPNPLHTRAIQQPRQPSGRSNRKPGLPNFMNPSLRSSSKSSSGSSTTKKRNLQPSKQTIVTSTPEKHDQSISVSDLVIPDEQSTYSTSESETNSASDFERIAMAAQAMDTAGNNYFQQADYEAAMHSYTRALKLKRRTLQYIFASTGNHADALLASVATSINNIGYLRQQSGVASNVQIMAAYQDSLQIKREILGPSHGSVAKTCNNIGSVYFSTREYENALQAYEEALGIMVHNLEEKDSADADAEEQTPEHGDSTSRQLDVATVHSNIGDVYLAQGTLLQARASYSSSLEIRWKFLDDHHPKVRRLLEKIAAIEMADTPAKLRLAAEQDDLWLSENSDKVFVEDFGEHELRALHLAVQRDVGFVDSVKRQLALDMIRDKITLLRGMRECVDSKDEDDIPEEHIVLTPDERNQALTEVKERVHSMKMRKGEVDEGDMNIKQNMSRRFESDVGDMGIKQNLSRRFESEAPLLQTNE